MFIISPPLFLATIVLFLIALLFFVIPIRFFHRRMQKVRDIWDILYFQFQSLTTGLKELMLNQRLRRSFLGDALIPTCRLQRDHTISGAVTHSFFARIGDMVLLLGLGGLLLSVKKFGWTSFAEFSQFLTITIFTLSPLSTVVAFLPRISRMKIALKKIQKAEMSLEDAYCKDNDSLKPLPVNAEHPYIRFKETTHTYFHEQKDKFFKLGPIDLEIDKGSTVFLVGGNGSGKSTLAKVLCGLYPPETGTLSYYGTDISSDYVDSYRDLFCAIFTDYYLFDDLGYIENERIAAKADEYLKLLEIDHKVKIIDNKISNIKLSEGQKKRIALLKALLEDKPFYIFDEWASGQDPYYKKIFYRSILPELKKEGKTIFVISHDEQFFDCADKVLILRDGQLIQNGIYYG